ncbi:MAG: hypothetical protein K6L81_02650 [Agarilytica sp.]
MEWLKSLFRIGVFKKTFATKTVTYADTKYVIREMDVGERLFLGRYGGDDQNSQLLACAQAVSIACKQFEGMDADLLAAKMSPNCLVFLANEALKFSKMHEDSIKEEEKKSESVPNLNSSAN